ncbi:cell wall-binding repeat-containing protein [Clostridiaceae bacterium UIB06]|uniref:Cell wall-binding repeat-containing protein n=1 Tax=Clostridium thailandense TaxID=2794346 RepID=A0A949WSI2_9CLOT|nr:cell wall-binding repeat-containing protein [Clostridium thailandense]MBV7275210.1 cell wall-binding repeat-containing protein [Clostridium thailandense]MCH5136846.1 cell wall-binding repeat-containing protein [Clostridiaceae bacterium UIB06]
MSKKVTRALASAAFISIVLNIALLTDPIKAASGAVTRIGEADRYATAAKVAITNWKTNDNVVLVSGEGYADAVSASALAKKLDAPILLTTSGALNVDAANAIDKLKAKNIYIVGGNASVSQVVRNELKDSYNLIELGGANRYETNAAVAQKLVTLGVDASNVIMVGGEGFSDALSVAPIAAAKGQILLLGTNSADSMKSILNFIDNNKSKVTVVGTINIIDDRILNSFGGTRINGGQDRFSTNLKVLKEFKDNIKTDKLYIANASGDGYADALVASVLAGKASAPAVLIDEKGITATTNAVAYIKDHVVRKTDLNVVGGIGVVSEETVESISSAAKSKINTENSIETVNLNQFKVYFNSAVDKDSAEDVTNYKVDGNALTSITGVAKAIDNKTVLVTLADPRKQNDDAIITVKKSILTADKSNTIDTFEQALMFLDTTVPTLNTVTVQGNNKITIELSEAVNMADINTLKNKIKIDGQNVSNYGIDSDTALTEIKNSIAANGKTWANEVELYFDSPIAAGTHTLEVLDGERNGVLSDAAGFTFKESSLGFTVDNIQSRPAITSLKETTNGEVHVTFDRAMDKKTALEAANYELNSVKLSTIDGISFDTDDNDCEIKIKGLTNIKIGSNVLYIRNNIKDAFGNKVADDTRVNFENVKDETKPTVTRVTAIDSETIRVKFSKDVNYSYATNKSNYELDDSKSTNITSHIDCIYSASGKNNNDNTNIYDIKLTKSNPSDSSDDWRLTGSNYTLTIKNIIDTVASPNTMEEYTTTLAGTDNVAPKVKGIYYKQNSSSGKDQVVVYFSEDMDANAITNKDNYKFVNGEGDTKVLPSNTSIIAGGDNKSAIIEFPASYHVQRNNGTITGETNDVIKMMVFNVKDETGNLLNGTAYTSEIYINLNGTKVKDDTIRVYYSGDDLKVDIQFDKAIDNLDASDFTLGGVAPTDASVSGDKVTLTFKDGYAATEDEKKTVPVIIFANGKTNNNKNTTKIDMVKAQGQKAYLGIKSNAKTTDETGASIASLSDTTGNSQNRIYDYEAAPETTSRYWSATKEGSNGKIYITFDTVLDTSSGVKPDDFVFINDDGTNLKADSVEINGNTVIFTFNNVSEFNNKIKVKAKSTASIRAEKDGDGNYTNYVPSNDDLKERSVTVTF